MKQVIIIIRPNLFYKTKAALIEEHFFAMSSKEVLGRGKKRIIFTSNDEDNEEIDSIYSDNMVAKKMIEICVRDEDLDRLIETIMKVNNNNNSGDGKIFVIPVDDCTRIHTGEKGDNALV